MAAGDRLIFSGLKWQAARVRRAGTQFFEVTASGRGRRWEATAAEGFWRSFAEIDLGDGAAVADFVQRYGDPHGMLDAGEPSHTGHWKNLTALLGVAARAWEPEDENGISAVTVDPQRLRLANWFMRDDPVPLLRDIKPELDPKGGPVIVLRATSLATFMALSAASALERRVAMRRCLHCRFWFEANRRDARFCSNSCRAFNAQRKGK